MGLTAVDELDRGHVGDSNCFVSLEPLRVDDVYDRCMLRFRARATVSSIRVVQFRIQHWRSPE
jgi:hypothetical protein